jgi:hypothetical protein
MRAIPSGPELALTLNVAALDRNADVADSSSEGSRLTSYVPTGVTPT